jgi:hypothetical protein
MNMAVSLKPTIKVSEKLKQLLNDAIAREIQVSIQYMWQHIQVVGVKGVAVQDKFQQTAVAEMKHAEKIAERLWYLEGTPTTKPAPISVGKSLKEFLELDTKAERKKPSRCTRRSSKWRIKKGMSRPLSYLRKSSRTKKNITTYLQPCSKKCSTCYELRVAGFGPKTGR